MDYTSLLELLSLEDNIPSNTQENSTFFKTINATITDINTKIVFADRTEKTFVILTQYQDLATFLVIKREKADALDKNTEGVFTVTRILGEGNPIQQAAAKFIAEKLDIKKPLCLFMCLANYEQDTVNALTTVLLDIKNHNI